MSSQPKHLNYIGSKHTLLDWLSRSILETTGWPSFTGKRIADLFAGSGVVSYLFRNLGATVHSNDIELCSVTVTKALTECVYSESSRAFLEEMNRRIQENQHAEFVGFVTKHYSPFNGCERMFFTVENAKRIDYIRSEIERQGLLPNDKLFVLASLLVSADAVANCASVYGAYLKQFKRTAERPLLLLPIHTLMGPSSSRTTQFDVLDQDFLQTIEADLVYLDPPYNERQYSKNYFPLSVLAMTPEEQERQVLKGKTGIPASCFTSPFCSKKTVEDAMKRVVSTVKSKWIFLSYNSESLLSKETLLEVLKPYGKATLVERPYKKFKNNQGVKKSEIKEYLFCLERE